MLPSRTAMAPGVPRTLSGDFMRYHLITGAILLAALVLYGIGFSLGAAVLIGGGAALELWFWVRAIRGDKRVANASAEVKA